MSGFDARGYWEGRLSERKGLDAVGWGGLGEGFNRWMYRLRMRMFRRVVAPLVPDPANAAVLDIGSGTGFYIDCWAETGVGTVIGSDITETAVERLQAAYPQHSFRRFDIGGDRPESFGRGFDAVSAFDVLFHIVDDQRFASAVENLAALVRPGGYLVFSDNFVHGAAVRQEHHVSRTLDDITRRVTGAGFDVVSRRPMFFLMNSPVDSHNRVLRFWWDGLTVVLGRVNALGGPVGAVLYPLEVLLTTLLPEGPSTELMICRRR